MRLDFLRWAAFLLLLLWSCSAEAIVNIEGIHLSDPVEGWTTSLSVGVDGSSGNSDQLGASAGGRVQWHRNERTDYLILSYRYGKSGGRTDTNRGFVHLRHMHHLNRRVSLEAFVQGARDEFARLKLRGLAGGGSRLCLLDQAPHSRIFLGLGAMFEYELLRFQSGASDELRTRLARANIYLSLKHRLTSNISVVSTTFYQPRVDEWADTRVLEQAALQVDVTSVLAFKVGLDVQYDSRPPQRVDTTDISYTTGLELSF